MSILGFLLSIYMFVSMLQKSIYKNKFLEVQFLILVSCSNFYGKISHISPRTQTLILIVCSYLNLSFPLLYFRFVFSFHSILYVFNYERLIFCMFCRELGIGIVPYSPLGRGFFGGKAVDENVPANSFLVWNQTYFQSFVYSFLLH